MLGNGRLVLGDLGISKVHSQDVCCTQVDTVEFRDTDCFEGEGGNVLDSDKMKENRKIPLDA